MILASASPRRFALLQALGFTLEVCPADIDESRLPNEEPCELVKRLARTKAHVALSACSQAEQGELLLAADTIVWDETGDIFGKPTDVSDAYRMLRRLSGVTHHVSTGVCVVSAGHPTEPVHEIAFVETTDVTFFKLNDTEIAAYVASGEPLDKAGAYGIQGLGALLVQEISGDYLNVVGLPLSRTVREIENVFGLQHTELLVSQLLQGTALNTSPLSFY